MSGSRRRAGPVGGPLVAVALTALALATLTSTTPEPAAAQAGRLDLVAQSFFVGDEPAVIDLRITNAAPAATLRVRVFAPRTTRSGIVATYGAIPTGSPLSDFPCDLGAAGDPEAEPDPNCPLSEIGSGGLYSLAMPDQEIGEIIRDRDGALPVVIDLLDGTRVVDTLTTHLLVLDDPPQPTLGIAFIADLSAELALRSDESIVVDGPALVARGQIVSARAEVPMTVEIRPETLDALDDSGDEQSLNALADLLSGRALVRSPWVDLDEEAWRAVAETDQVLEQYTLGVTTVEEALGTSPSGIALLDPDATPATLGLLRRAGVTGVVVDTDRITPPGRAVHQPVQILDDNGVAMPAVRIDEDLHDTLDHPDAELAGHRALAELALTAHQADGDLGVVLDVTRVDPVALDVVLAGITERRGLRTSTLDRLLGLPPARTATGAPVRVELRPDTAPDLTTLAADLQVTRGALAAYAAMVAPADAPVAPLRRLLLAAASTDLDPEEASDYTTAVFDAVLEGTDGIGVVEGDRITLTSRTADLPLVLRNDQPLPVTVTLVLSAEKLRFPDGERQTVVLQPGENPREIRVETLASGDARVTATLTSPDGRIELASGIVDIRSTAISGLGLIISIVALAILGSWWARTIVRIRRSRSAATVAPAPVDSEPMGGRP